MKKLFCSIASLATSVFTFIFLSIPFMVQEVAKQSGSYSGWEIIKNSKTEEGFTATLSEVFEAAKINGYSLCRIFAIVALVVACLLAIIGIILLLQQFGIIKSEMNFRLIASIGLAIYTVVTLISMIGVIQMIGGSELTKVMGMTSSIGVGIILMLVVGAIATVISFLFSRSKK